MRLSLLNFILAEALHLEVFSSNTLADSETGL